jgi:hypothetical protein
MPGWIIAEQRQTAERLHASFDQALDASLPQSSAR